MSICEGGGAVEEYMGSLSLVSAIVYSSIRITSHGDDQPHKMSIISFPICYSCYCSAMVLLCLILMLSSRLRGPHDRIGWCEGKGAVELNRVPSRRMESVVGGLG